MRMTEPLHGRSERHGVLDTRSQRRLCWRIVAYPRQETFDPILRHSPRRVAQPSSESDGTMTIDYNLESDYENMCKDRSE